MTAAPISTAEARRRAELSDRQRYPAPQTYLVRELADQLDRQSARIAELEGALGVELVHLADSYGTHWDGCEVSHRKCAAVKRIQAALAGGKAV